MTLKQRVEDAITREINRQVHESIKAGERKPLIVPDIALKAIEAMREPTEAMFMAGSNAEPYTRNGVGRLAGRRIGDLPARDCWRLMIDAALRD